MFRELKQYTVEEIGCFERKRRRSWDIGDDGIESLTLQIRAIIHEEDLEFVNKLAPANIQKRESSKTISPKFAFDSSPLCPPPVRRFPNAGKFIKTGSMINGISSKDFLSTSKIVDKERRNSIRPRLRQAASFKIKTQIQKKRSSEILNLHQGLFKDDTGEKVYEENNKRVNYNTDRSKCKILIEDISIHSSKGRSSVTNEDNIIQVIHEVENKEADSPRVIKDPIIKEKSNTPEHKILMYKTHTIKPWLSRNDTSGAANFLISQWKKTTLKPTKSIDKPISISTNMIRNFSKGEITSRRSQTRNNKILRKVLLKLHVARSELPMINNSNIKSRSKSRISYNPNAFNESYLSPINQGFQSQRGDRRPKLKIFVKSKSRQRFSKAKVFN